MGYGTLSNYSTTTATANDQEANGKHMNVGLRGALSGICIVEAELISYHYYYSARCLVLRRYQVSQADVNLILVVF